MLRPGTRVYLKYPGHSLDDRSAELLNTIPKPYLIKNSGLAENIMHEVVYTIQR